MVKQIILLIFVLFLVGCSNRVSIEGISIEVEIADTGEKKALGLMDRESLKGGMLFVFEDSKIRSFWMKNTLIPLDIIFINSKKEIIDIQTMEPCIKDPCQNYISKQPTKYALEVNKGFVERNNIEIGDKVKI